MSKLILATVVSLLSFSASVFAQSTEQPDESTNPPLTLDDVVRMIQEGAPESEQDSTAISEESIEAGEESETADRPLTLGEVVEMIRNGPSPSENEPER